MLIERKQDKISFAPDFKLSEFFKGAIFELPDALIKAAQSLRDWFGQPIIISSTYRPADTFGYHREGKAVDFIAANYTLSGDLIARYNTEVANYLNGTGSNLITQLRKDGITGFGVEKVCIHLDCRPETACNRTDEFGRWLAFKFDYYIDGHGKMVITENRAL